MKLSKDYCQVLHWGRKNPFQIYRLGSNSAGKALVGSKLNVSQQCALGERQPAASWAV